MKNIVIRSGSLRMGGLERVLIEVLQNFDLKKYRISLLIEDDSGEDNIFLKEIPKEIDLYFIKNKEMIENTEKYRKKKKNFFYKMIYNYKMYKEHSYVPEKTKEILREIEDKFGEIESFIDYDWGARRYIQDLKVKNKIIWIHNSVSRMLRKKSKIERFGKNLKKYDKVVAICDEMKEELENLYPYLKGKVWRIYNPFNFTRIEKLSMDNENLSRSEKKLLEKKYILAVSRLDTAQKDYETLLKAYKYSIEKGIEEDLYIVGDGPSRKEIEEIVKDLKVEDRVKILGMKANPYIWMKNCSFFVHSSRYEGFGLVLIEAACLKKMVVCSKCDVGPREILGNGKYGPMFEIGNYEELGRIIIEGSKNLEYRERFEIKAKERANDFQASKIMQEYYNIIDRGILDEKHKSIGNYSSL